jgi:hypothetical protein
MGVMVSGTKGSGTLLLIVKKRNPAEVAGKVVVSTPFPAEVAGKVVISIHFPVGPRYCCLLLWGYLAEMLDIRARFLISGAGLQDNPWLN